MSHTKLYMYIFVMNILAAEMYMLPKMNHGGCLENDEKIIHFIVGESLKTCIQECVARINCLSLNYRRKHKLCELFAAVDGTFVTNNGKTGPCVHIHRSNITGPKYAEKIQSCSQENAECVATECPNLELPNVVFIGNMREIGSRLLVKCVSVFYLDETGRTNIQCRTDGTWDYIPNCISAYIGCYKDNSRRILMHEKSSRNRKMTIEKCITNCLGYGFAAPQSKTECYCGNRLNDDLKRPEAECNTPCMGDRSQMCGGPWRGSVYRLK